jgi:D-apiose dehydrogenase
MKPLRFAVFGAGFWTPYQLAGWREFSEVECVAIYNRTGKKAEKLAADLRIPAVYDDARKLLDQERIDFVDNITEIDGHLPLSVLCAEHRLPCICQKPMARSVAEAQAMVAEFKKVAVPLYIHENWRWQTPIRAAKRALSSGVIGRPFRARIEMITGFEGWANQPALAQLERFILTDLGTHILDVARFLFGEATTIFCSTKNTLPKILRGENVATIQLETEKDITVVCQLGYALTPLEREHFPETFLFVEGEHGSLEIAPNFSLRTTTKQGTVIERYPPPRYSWANPRYDLVHASIVDCTRNLLAGLRGQAEPETTAEDNLKTIELVFACYDSAEQKNVIQLPAPDSTPSDLDLEETVR